MEEEKQLRLRRKRYHLGSLYRRADDIRPYRELCVCCFAPKPDEREKPLPQIPSVSSQLLQIDHQHGNIRRADAGDAAGLAQG